ncbi:hypothetical protein HRR95_001175 [Exophiala dermatitidis]|nr:hypothetical protein HRR75_001077 [Exophiala dermatitidis]KAJ4559650.1 hypothetical protein HRR78_000170 [Exophiala dermatitidis]KAJ4686997.1 hypothetical protein HRR95_001175 [Exophiala dermatitidis]
MVSETFAGKAQSVLDFASHLQEFLAKDQDSSSLEFPDVLFYVRALPLPRKELTPSHRLEFDRKGVAIWNTCCKLAGKSGSPRYLAHLAEDTGLLETAARIVEQLAAKQDGLSQASQENILNASNFEGDSNVKYLLLRVALVRLGRRQAKRADIIQAWKQDRLDLADHFYAQLEAMQKEMSSTRMGQLVDLCYGIGKDQFNRRPREPDIKWLKRACLISSCTNAETADVDMQELRLTLLHTYGPFLPPVEDFPKVTTNFMRPSEYCVKYTFAWYIPLIGPYKSRNLATSYRSCCYT